MKFPRNITFGLAVVALACCLSKSSSAFAQMASDNSQTNKNQSPTADNQSNAKADRLTTASVRKALIADKNLSLYAHNVKVITSNGQVTLKGPVKSEDEKQQVASHVASVVSSDKINNQLTIKQ